MSIALAARGEVQSLSSALTVIEGEQYGIAASLQIHISGREW